MLAPLTAVRELLLLLLRSLDDRVLPNGGVPLQSKAHNSKTHKVRERQRGEAQGDDVVVPRGRRHHCRHKVHRHKGSQGL